MIGLAIKEVSLNGRNHFWKNMSFCFWISEIKFFQWIVLEQIMSLTCSHPLVHKKILSVDQNHPFHRRLRKCILYRHVSRKFRNPENNWSSGILFSSYIHFRSFQLVHNIFQVIEVVVMFFDTVWYFSNFLFFIQSYLTRTNFRRNIKLCLKYFSVSFYGDYFKGTLEEL